MTIRNKLLFPIIIILFLTGFTGYMLFLRSFSNLSESIIEKNRILYLNSVSDFSQEKIDQIYNDIGRVGMKALGMASLFSEWEAVADAYIIAHIRKHG